MKNGSCTSVAQRRGVILIVVLVLVAMMSLSGFTFMTRMATEYEATLTHGDLRQAQQTLASAETLLIHLAQQQAAQPDAGNQLQHNPALFSSRVISPAAAPEVALDASRSVSAPRLRWRFSVVHRLLPADEWAQMDSGPDEGNPLSSLRFGLLNESAKLHLERVLQWETEEAGAGRRALMQIPRMTEVAADSILDWIDADHEPREFGAEQDHYSLLDRPYAPRNGLPQSLEELLFVKGVTRDAFYGTGQSSEAAERSNAPWTDLITLHAAEPNRSRFGQERINLNDVYPSDYASAANGLPAELSFLPEPLVKYILLARLHGIWFFPTSADPAAASSAGSAAHAELSLEEIEITADEFVELAEFSSLADLIGTSVQLPVAMGGHRVDSPLNVDSSDFTETMKQLEDRVTVSFEDTLIGRININAASEPVLLALTDDAQVVSQIVQQRQLLDPSERESTAWLLTRQVVDLQAWRRIAPHITTRGSVHSGEIIVYRESGGPFLRRRLIIDGSSTPPRRVTWLDLTERGLPVDLSALRYRRSDFPDTRDFADPGSAWDDLSHLSNRVSR